MTSTAPPPEGRLLARNTLLNLLGFGAPMVVALLAVPVLIDGLGMDRFGVLAIAWMFLAYLGELGFGSTTTKFVAEALGGSDGTKLGAIAWTTAAMQFVVGALEGIALALAAPWLAERVFNVPPELWPETRSCLYLLAAALPVIGLSKSFQGVLEAGQRFDLITAVRMPAIVANYVLPLAGVLAGWSLPAIFGLVLVSRGAVLVTYVVMAIRAFPGVPWRPAFQTDRWRRMAGFGGWVAVSTVVSPLLVSLDRFLVGILLSMTAVTYYAAPYEVVARLAIIPMSVVTTLYPAFSQLGSGGVFDRVSTLAARGVKAILLVVTPVALALIGGAVDGLAVWLGAEFAEQSAVALQLLGVGVLINAAAHVPHALLQGTGRPDVPARFHLLELPLHAAVAWVMISRWGIAGAAGAWTLRVSLDAVLLFTASHRLGLLRLRALESERVFRTMAMVLTGCGALMALSHAGTATVRLGMTGAVILVILVVIWRYGLMPAERSRFAMLIRSAEVS